MAYTLIHISAGGVLMKQENYSTGNFNLRSEILQITGLTALVLLLMLLLGGCSISGDDFTDTVQDEIKTIIKEDEQLAYGVDVVNDSSDISAPQKGSAEFSSLAALLPRFGRKIESIERTFQFFPEDFDTTVAVAVTHTLKGFLNIRDSNEVQVSKVLEHNLSRVITFAKRDNKWVHTSISGAFGYSADSKLVLDSLIIRTATDSIVIGNATDFIFYTRNPFSVKRGETISISVRAFNTSNLLDRPFGTVLNGQNKTRERTRFNMDAFLGGRYERTFTLKPTHKIGFNQLVVDFMTPSSLSINVNKKYDSFMVLIPYFVEE